MMELIPTQAASEGMLKVQVYVLCRQATRCLRFRPTIRGVANHRTQPRPTRTSKTRENQALILSKKLQVWKRPLPRPARVGVSLTEVWLISILFSSALYSPDVRIENQPQKCFHLDDC